SGAGSGFLAARRLVRRVLRVGFSGVFSAGHSGSRLLTRARSTAASVLDSSLVSNVICMGVLLLAICPAAAGVEETIAGYPARVLVQKQVEARSGAGAGACPAGASRAAPAAIW